MPKRSRYWNVVEKDGMIQILAKKHVYAFPSIERWTFAEVTNKFNPEQVDYTITVFYPNGETLLVCNDQEEYSTIISELRIQQIAKRN
jgi:hypothetical protein